MSIHTNEARHLAVVNQDGLTIKNIPIDELTDKIMRAVIEQNHDAYYCIRFDKLDQQPIYLILFHH